MKEYNCRVKIFNNLKSKMTYVRDLYDSGRMADSFFWPQIIEPGHAADILNYERNWSFAGCSGYVTYEMLYMEITIAFSNPDVGSNKLPTSARCRKQQDSYVYNKSGDRRKDRVG